MFLEEKKFGEVPVIIPPITTPTLEPWRQLLLNAADHMEKVGKTRFAMAREDGRVCTIGAMFHVSDASFNGMFAREGAIKHFAAYVNPSYVGNDCWDKITHWNDNPLALWRTKSWVVRQLRDCAKYGY